MTQQESTSNNKKQMPLHHEQKPDEYMINLRFGTSSSNLSAQFAGHDDGHLAVPMLVPFRLVSILQTGRCHCMFHHSSAFTLGLSKNEWIYPDDVAILGPEFQSNQTTSLDGRFAVLPCMKEPGAHSES